MSEKKQICSQLVDIRLHHVSFSVPVNIPMI